MSSLFRARVTNEPRSSGKVLRRRRAKPSPSPSPYARPESSPAAAQAGSPRWLSGLISGAGKLISSVLPSYRSSSSPSSDHSSVEGETSSDDYEDEDVRQRLDQTGNEPQLVNNCMDGSLALVSKSESKLAIEQLLMQETFTREECDKLTKLIQSRIVNLPSREVRGDQTEELRSRRSDSDALPGVLPSVSQKKTLTERVPYSSNKPNLLYPGSSVFEACTPDICNKAVSEAKKWFEEKKSSSKPKYDTECGPCTLNTDMFQYGIDSEVGSPVDMAKSYMRSLPPWRSPSFSRVGFKTSPASGKHYYNEETSYGTAKSSFPSSSGLKRDHLSIGSWDIHDETRRVHLKFTDDKLEISNSKKMESSARAPEHESSKSVSEADKRGNITSSDIVSEPEHIIGAMPSNNGASRPITCSQGTVSLNKQHSQPTDEMDNVSLQHNTHALASRLVEHDGVSALNLGNTSSEIEVMLQENNNLAVPSDADNVANLNDVHTANVQTSTGVGGTAVSNSLETNSISDPKSHDGNSHIPKKTNGSIVGISANGSLEEIDANSNRETTLTEGTNTVVPQNGTKMTLTETILNDPKPIRGRNRKKVVKKSLRGRKS